MMRWSAYRVWHGARVSAGFVHAHVWAGSLKRVNDCNTGCSSVRVTAYYELNNVMIATAPVPQHISASVNYISGVSGRIVQAQSIRLWDNIIVN